MTTSIFIIPGLGGPEALSRVDLVVRRWQDKRTSVHMFDSRWDGQESIHNKHKRLLEFYDNNSDSKRVVVVGFSAGGALATTLLSQRKDIDKVILLSAKIKGSNTIGQPFVDRAPAIIEAVKASEKALTNFGPELLKKVASFRPFFDGVVPLGDMSVYGMQKKHIPIIGHAVAIGFALIFQVRRLFKEN